jgi:hypothetical protein
VSDGAPPAPRRTLYGSPRELRRSPGGHTPAGARERRRDEGARVNRRAVSSAADRRVGDSPTPARTAAAAGRRC